ncbi:MAG: hypothetical protein FVQ81_05730 [Candidatus Glassbacteria bacterium]|nr:hypothetical protein [Candidatus Glassbacteria bacterium]
MQEFNFIAGCSACGAKNRVRLTAGRKVRIRCGRCGQQLGIDRRRMVLSAIWQKLSAFFSSTLPLFLLWAVGGIMSLLGGILRPLGKTWGVLPWRLRKQLAWIALAVLAVFFFLSEGTIRFSSLLILALLLVLASVVVVVAARGPSALWELKSMFGGTFLRRCPNCGHRYFGWVKNCPNCGD